MTDTPFPVGAWVRDPSMPSWPPGFAGEIIGVGTIGRGKRWPVYLVKWADHDGVVDIARAVCDNCESPSDAEHDPWCAYAPEYRRSCTECGPGYLCSCPREVSA